MAPHNTSGLKTSGWRVIDGWVRNRSIRREIMTGLLIALAMILIAGAIAVTVSATALGLVTHKDLALITTGSVSAAATALWAGLRHRRARKRDQNKRRPAPTTP